MMMLKSLLRYKENNNNIDNCVRQKRRMEMKIVAPHKFNEIIKLIIDKKMSDWHYRNNLNVFHSMAVYSFVVCYVRMVKW